MTLELGSLLFTQLWQVTALAVVVWGAVRWLAGDRPHLAHALWLLVLIKCITPPILASPTSLFSWLQSGRIAKQTTQTGPLAALDQSSAFDRSPSGSSLVIRTNLFGHEGSGRTRSQDGSVQVPKLDDLQAARQLPTGASLSSQSKRSSWLTGLAALWVFGAVLALVVAAIRLLLFWRSTVRKQVIAEPWLEQAVSKWASELGLKRHVRIRVVDSPIGPAVIGLIRPLILLPAVLVEGRNENDLRPLLTHELIHIRRGDLCWSLIQTFAGSWFWFHPLIRFGVRMVTRESERSCDEETVANLGCSPSAYARCLLDILELKQSLRVAPAVPGIRPVDITSNRMERIMKLGHGCQKRTPFWVWLVMLACGSAVLPGAALVLGQGNSEPPTGSRLRPAPTSDDRLPIIKQGGEADAIENAKDSVSLIESYEIADLLSQADNVGDQNLKPGAKLMQILPQRDRLNSTTGALVKGIDSDGKVMEFFLGASEPNTKIVGERLYAFGSNEFRLEIRQVLKRLRESGFHQIAIEVSFISADSAALEKLGLTWENGSLESDNKISAMETIGTITMMPEVKFDPGMLVDEDFKKLAFEISLKSDDDQNTGSIRVYPDLDQVCQAPTHRREDTQQCEDVINGLQRSHIAQYAIKRTDEIDQLIKGLIDYKDTVLVQAPKIRVFSGGSAKVMDGSHRPFVIGVNRQNDNTSQPLIGMVHDGLKVILNPSIQPNSSVRIASQLLISKVESCETYSLDKSWSNEDHGDVTIQLPVASFLGFNSDIEIPAHHALILRTQLPTARSNERAPSLAIIRCKVIEPEAESQQQIGFDVYIQAPTHTFTTKVPAGVGYLIQDGRLRMTRGYADVIKPQAYEALVYERLPELPDRKSQPDSGGLPLLSNIPDASRLFRNVGVPRALENPEVIPVDDESSVPKYGSTATTLPTLESAAPLIARLFKNRGSVERQNGQPDYYLTDDLQFSRHRQPQADPESLFARVHVCSLDESKEDASKTIVERLDGLGIELHLDTEVERVQTSDGLLVRGQRLFFELKDFELACDQGELEIKSEGNFRFSGKGVSIERGLELSADRVEVTRNAPKQIIIELHGNSEVAFDGRKFKADKIKMFCADSKVYLEGDATISQTIGDRVTKTSNGKKIFFDIIRETELVIEH